MVPDAWAYKLDFIGLLLLFFLSILILRLSVGRCASGVTDASATSAKPKGPVRPLKLRTPDDCPQCVHAGAPAMAAGSIDRRWTVVELLSYPVLA